MKTVRFRQVVAQCGEPHVHTLWVAPEKDAEFQHALKSDRVLTIEHDPGKTDFGVVGFDARKTEAREFLIFPKSLRRFEGARVVGIKFDLVSQPPQIRATRSTGTAATGIRHHHPRRGRRPGVSSTVPHPKRSVVEPTRVTPPARRRVGAPAHTHETKLRHQVRRALKELAAGKNVAAYQRLERAVSPEDDAA